VTYTLNDTAVRKGQRSEYNCPFLPATRLLAPPGESPAALNAVKSTAIGRRYH
jgi:hypothetical protein